MNYRDFDKIFSWFEADTIKFIDKILCDDKKNLEFSAITCNNRLVLLIRNKKEYKKKYKSIEEYLEDIGYEKKDICIFVENRNKEKEYYIGEIYTL